MVSKAERLQQQYEVSKARADSAKAALAELRRIQNQKAKKEARKKRNHALFESAGLMILADLVVSESGLPAVDRGALLGGLMAVAKTLEHGPESTRFQEWKSAGDALLAEREAARTSPSVKTPATTSDQIPSGSAIG
ncbi:conjugal transfer protein TraD [Acidithiobacillus ferridurans]|nr:conjugal transfer protein TraD [Acidithiobacillus ferridurans]